MTSNTVRKEGAVRLSLGGRRVVIGAMAKEAGMIHPNMAAMLCVVATDAAVDRATLVRVTSEAVEQSFNRISVDGDMSTNETGSGSFSMCFYPHNCQLCTGSLQEVPSGRFLFSQQHAPPSLQL